MVVNCEWETCYKDPVEVSFEVPSPNLPDGNDGSESKYHTRIHDDWSSGLNPDLSSAKQEWSGIDDDDDADADAVASHFCSCKLVS